MSRLISRSLTLNQLFSLLGCLVVPLLVCVWLINFQNGIVMNRSFSFTTPTQLSAGLNTPLNRGSFNPVSPLNIPGFVLNMAVTQTEPPEMSGSVYPTLIKTQPASQPAELTASDGGAGDNFGYSVAFSADGNTALVGAIAKGTGSNSRPGAAYIFSRSGVNWLEQAELIANNGVDGDEFGRSVALSSDGNTALVGASRTYPKSGSAYVFTRSGANWTQQAELTANDARAGGDFGNAVKLSGNGNTALISAPSYAAAYIFSRSGTNWLQQNKLTANDGGADPYVGVSVGLSQDGNTAIVSGRIGVYIFGWNGVSWVQQDKRSDISYGQVALSGDGSTAVIGEVTKQVGNNPSQGIVYVLSRSGTNWLQQTTLTANDGASGDNFGNAVVLSNNGNTVLVGAFFKNIGSNMGQGKAYIFSRSGTSWLEQEGLTGSDEGPGDNYFGYSADLSGDGGTALVGATIKNIGNNGHQGAAYVFTIPKPTQTQLLIAQSGGGQSTTVSTAFGLPFVARLTDAYNNPISGTTVSFTAPSNGPGGTLETGLTNFTGTTNQQGVVTSSVLTANSLSGLYVVTATVNGSISATFQLTNLPTCDPFQITSNVDDNKCGTLRQALLAASNGPTKTVTIGLPSGSVITLNKGLTLSNGITITTVTSCIGGVSPIIIQGSGINSGDGLTLASNDALFGIWIRGFSGKQIVAPISSHTVMNCVRASKS